MKLGQQATSFVVLVAAAAALGYFAPHISTRGDGARKVVATVAGQAVYEDELLPRAQRELTRLRNEEFEILSRALDALINERLLEAEAKKRGLEPQALLFAEVDSQVPPPSDEEVQALYESRRAQIGRPFETVKDQIRRIVHEARIEEAREAWYAQLRKTAGVAVLLRPPKVEVAADPARFRGPAGAPVVIVEFSDFQCPYCRRAMPVVEQVLEKYKGRVSHSFRDFPLDDIHPRARAAAQAARCAGDQKKFWEYHRLLFTNFGQLARETLLAHAAALSLDQAQFAACLDSGKYASAVEADFQEGQRLGVEGTPAFFVNGIMLSGAQPLAAFERVIDAELAALKQ